MKNFIEFLESIEISKESLTKGFEELIIDRTILKKKSGICVFYLSSKSVVLHERLENIRKEMEKKLCPPIDSIKVILKIEGYEKKPLKKVIKKYWPNIFYLIKQNCPSVLAYSNDLEHLCIDDLLKIKAPNEFIFNRLKEKELDEKIKTMIFEELGIEVNVILEKAKENKHEEDEIKKIIKKKL